VELIRFPIRRHWQQGAFNSGRRFPLMPHHPWVLRFNRRTGA